MSHKPIITDESYPHYNNKKDKEKTMSNGTKFTWGHIKINKHIQNCWKWSRNVSVTRDWD